MKKLASLVIFSLFLIFQNEHTAQLNFDSLSHISYVNSHDTYLNDVWGHVDVLGNEYALVGARKGFSIVDVTVPESPNEVFWIDGTESIWRDVNTYNNFAYITTEAESGLLILDMNSLPIAAGITSKYYQGPAGNEWQSAHTIFVDSLGFAYVFGANRGNGGVIILDIKTDPLNPIEVGVFDTWYCHDGYVLGDTMYLAHIADGFMSIVDISDRANPVLVNTINTKNNFTHNIWTSPDRKYAFTTDEVSGAYVGSYDISDPSNIKLLDLVQSSPGKNVIPHNVHYLNEYLVTSYYSDGVVIFDAHRPQNLIQVGNFDTYPTQTTGFDGCWASYPFLPSGIMLAADITEGLFIARPTYQRASYLEGNVTDASTSNPLPNVKVTFENSPVEEFTKTNGDYATGLLGVGNYNVTFFKVGYYTQTFSVPMTAGFVNVLNVAMVPIPSFSLKVNVKDASNNQALLNANVKVKGSLTDDNKLSNGLGEASFSLFYEENYTITVGKWTFKTTCLDQLIDNQTGNITISLDKGIYDDFTFDFGWTTAFNGATKGFWEKGKPNATESNSAPGLDSDTDCGEEAYVTGNDPNVDPDFDDVRTGEVSLYSPIFDLSNSNNKYIHFDRWFYNYYGPFLPYDDSLKIFVSNGDSTVLIDIQGSDITTFYKWHHKSFYLPDFIGLSANMQVIVKTSDFDPNKNITEAGFDNFFMDSINHYSSVPKIEKKLLAIYPNPFQNEIVIENAELDAIYEIFDLQGNKVSFGKISSKKEIIKLLNLNQGMYFILLNDKFLKVIKS